VVIRKGMPLRRTRYSLILPGLKVAKSRSGILPLDVLKS
jgi:hypothetical protein